MDWFRSHHGAPTDPKWLAVAAKAGTRPGVVAAVWWALMDRASQASPRGSVEGFDTEALAAFYGWPEEEIVAVIGALRNKGMIDADGMLSAWMKRQVKRERVSDVSTERVRKHRERKQKASNDAIPGHETPRNATKRPEEIRGEEIRDKENSGRSLAIESDLPPVPEPSSHTVASVTMEAHRVLGMEQWGGELTAKYRETRSIIDRHWLGRGVQLDSVYRAIHGLRTMVDNGEVEWLADRRGKPLDGLEVLLKSAVVPGPDGPQMRPLFQLAQEAYARPGPPSRTASTGPVNVSGILANLKAQGSRT